MMRKRLFRLLYYVIIIFYTYNTSLAVNKCNEYKKRSIAEAWLADKGTYPLIAIIPFTIIFGIGSGLYIMATTPDARIFKFSRKKLLRGDSKII